MKVILLTAVCLGIVLFLAWPAMTRGDSWDDHDVTVQVLAINEAAISGGDVTLTINSATAGQDPDDVVDNTTCNLAWTTNETGKKVTVATDLGSQSFTLEVVAQNVTGGSAAPQVTLSTTATDFVTGVATTTGGCDLQYTASATAAQGTGTDSHTVTYTLTDV